MMTMRSQRNAQQQDEHDVGIQLASTRETLIAEIETVRLKGEIKALVEKLAILKYQLVDTAFKDVYQNEKYVRLETAIRVGRNILDMMEVYLKELQKLDPSQK